MKNLPQVLKPDVHTYAESMLFAATTLFVTMLLLGHKTGLAVLGYTVTRKHGVKMWTKAGAYSASVTPLAKADDISKSILSEVKRAATDDLRIEYCNEKVDYLKEIIMAIQEGSEPH